MALRCAVMRSARTLSSNMRQTGFGPHMHLHKRDMAVYRLGDVVPLIDRDAWVAPNATVVGNVQLDKGASVWFGATLRGDNELIHVRENSNVQDGSVLHTDQGFPLTIGKNVTIGECVSSVNELCMCLIHAIC
jgi:carbonic anhydrase/acetyltransferase-like protein (isoleucine patch superfamily)